MPTPVSENMWVPPAKGVDVLLLLSQVEASSTVIVPLGAANTHSSIVGLFPVDLSLGQGLLGFGQEYLPGGRVDGG